MELNDFFLMFGALAGVSALVPAVVNALKHFEVVSDGQSGKAQTLINFLMFIAFAGVKMFMPDFDPTQMDQLLAQSATVITGMLTLLAQFAISKKTYGSFWKGRAGIFGLSFDDDLKRYQRSLEKKEVVDNS